MWGDSGAGSNRSAPTTAVAPRLPLALSLRIHILIHQGHFSLQQRVEGVVVGGGGFYDATLEGKTERIRDEGVKSVGEFKCEKRRNSKIKQMTNYKCVMGEKKKKTVRDCEQTLK